MSHIMDAAKASSLEFEEQTYGKVARRLVPFLFLCYFAAYLDRVNVGFAKLQMLDDLSFSNTVLCHQFLAAHAHQAKRRGRPAGDRLADGHSLHRGDRRDDLR